MTSLAAVLITLVSKFTGVDAAYWAMGIVGSGVLFELCRRSKEGEALKARLVEKLAKKRVEDFKEKFSPSQKTSALSAMAVPDYKLGPSLLWRKYQDCYSTQLGRELQAVETRLYSAARASDLRELSRTFIEIYHILYGYGSFLSVFNQEFKDKLAVDPAIRWFRNVLDEYDKFVDRLEEDLRGIESELNEKLGAPLAHKSSDLISG